MSAVVLAAVFSSILMGVAAPEPRKPNVIIILVDTLRKDHLGCYGYERDTSPNIDRFAKDATLFKNAFAQGSSTKPSIASLFTSQYPTQHNSIGNTDALNSDYTTLAEVLRGNGFVTAAFVENDVIYPERFMYNQGFDVWKAGENRRRRNEELYSWLDENSDEQFFLYAHFLDPHFPYNAPGEFKNHFARNYSGKIQGNLSIHEVKQIIKKRDDHDLEHVVASYDDEVRYIDSRFGDLVEKLKELGLYDRSIIIFLSDHGEGFWEHKMLSHSYSVYSELVNIPLIVRYPKVFSKRENHSNVQHVDIFPTLMSVLDIDASGLSFEGNDISVDPGSDVAIVSEHLRHSDRLRKERQRSIVVGDWKFILHLDRGIEHLFNVKDDPLDQNDLIDEKLEIAAELRLRLSRWSESIQDKREPTKVELDSEIEENLRALGYME